MFKKLKDKLAEEVKSSPQRIQQFAQAAQAAVTSASSSISDITNSDLFSIGDNEGQAGQTAKQSTSTAQANAFQEVSLMQSSGHTSSEPMNFAINHEDNPRQRRLSNSSFASDISFRLPSYESPSMYHLQSDMEVSASEAEERGFSSGAVSLDRVTKEQLYAAYRRTQERYTKYRTQYADLARHYKLLERENAKARSVLVETQDKALRRISELREQCSLEQSAKAHLEKALRVEIEERNLKIEALNTKISLLQNINESNIRTPENVREKPLVDSKKSNENDVQLINLSPESEDAKLSNNEVPTNEQGNLASKLEKMEQLLNKYKESLKSSKEKNSQLTIELTKISTELDNQMKENNKLKAFEVQLVEARQKIQELNIMNEELQNKVNTYDFAKTKELTTLEMDLQKSKEEIVQLRGKIDIFSKREEEYAISLAENKLSIHKELESKESEIKSLKDHLSAAKKELQSLNIIINDYKNNVTALEEERSKLNNEVNESNLNKAKITEMESQILVLTQKCQSLEQLRVKSEEEIKCLQLQMKQETAEKLAMIDRNDYLENRNALLVEENTKRTSQITHLENELLLLKKENASGLNESAKQQLIDEIEFWKAKFNNLEAEIQDERVELAKLQTEIEKLLRNHELIQSQNSELHGLLEELKTENSTLRQKVSQNINNITSWESIADKVKDLQKTLKFISNDTKTFKKSVNDEIPEMRKNIATLDIFSQDFVTLKNKYDKLESDYQILQNDAKSLTEELSRCSEELNTVKANHEHLNSQIQLNVTEKLELQKEMQILSDKFNANTTELKSVKNDKQILTAKLEEVENKCLHLQAAVDDGNNHQKEIQNLSDKFNATTQELNSVKNEKQILIAKLEEVENKCLHLQTALDDGNNHQKEMQNLTDKLNATTQELKSIKNDKQILIAKLEEVENKCLHLQTAVDDGNNHQKEIQNLSDKFNATTQELNSVKNDKQILIAKLEEVENKCLHLQAAVDDGNNHQKEIQNLSDKFNATTQELKSVKNDKQILIAKLEEVENKCLHLQAAVDDGNNQYLEALDNLKVIQDEKRTLVKKIDKIEKENELLNTELEKLKIKHKDDISHITSINSEKEQLLQAVEDKEKLIEKNNQKVTMLSQENITLKNQCESIANSVKDLEDELNEVRKSHADIEGEKDRLTSLIEILEKKEQAKEISNKDIQTEINLPSNTNSSPTSKDNDEIISLLKNIDELNLKNSKYEDDIKHLKETITQLTNKNVEITEDNLKKVNSITAKCQELQNDYDMIKEENRRLHSDIEGLQTYLAKISKENGVLNDKLRELIASSENTIRSDYQSNELLELQNEVLADKEKIDDLTRENTLLIEENLELKDQLQSQNYADTKNSTNNNENDAVTAEKYNNLLGTKNELEEKVNCLEQMNRSINGNMQQIQGSNEKLKLTNEKLERRLDEALVSLRHLHSLQENTELEYLKNILYEYLTGSGTHSVTLAKVLAAVVKFDDKQTQQVLQKEKERQGILRQLGLL
ncbi:hypothetical protein ABMA28_012045 [Loxostege sticticalis]|uniref:GRIP domain-containing protein n=1 Tax=Loxostege sticticalis TaxID=481309 RepID=A0ABD0TLH3_LOXSC